MRYDTVVFGSGFAAYEVVRVLAERGRRVCVVEKGGLDLAMADPAASRVPYLREPIVSGGFDFGVQVPEAFNGVPRYIGLGGTSALWSGKWRRLDRVDLERHRGDRAWPVSHVEMTAAYDAVATQYGWPDWPDDEAQECSTLVAEHGLRLIEMYEEAPPIRLQSRWLELRRNGDVQLRCLATIEGCHHDTSGRLAAVQVADDTGRVRLEADRFVVACGGIESVHVSERLRASRATDTPVRYAGFVDHPKGFFGVVVPARNLPLLTFVGKSQITSKRLFAFSLPEDEVKAVGCGNHTVFATSEDRASWRLMISLEQFPEEDNFIEVSPRAAVSWHVSAHTRADATVFLDRFLPRFEQLIGPVSMHAALTLRGASHHCSALPFGASPSSLLDPGCQFRDVENLYCVSSAVFPFAGSANPTMTVVALSHRLGRRLTV